MQVCLCHMLPALQVTLPMHAESVTVHTARLLVQRRTTINKPRSKRLLMHLHARVAGMGPLQSLLT